MNVGLAREEQYHATDRFSDSSLREEETGREGRRDVFSESVFLKFLPSSSLWPSNFGHFSEPAAGKTN